jgi:two-component system, chemotaxis family, sensor kinase CheA
MDNTLQDIFIQEADENLQLLETRIISFEEHPNDTAIINEAFRAIHSIKGGAGLAGFPGVKDFTHVVEDLFENIRSGSLQIEASIISIILEAMDVMKQMIENIKNGLDSHSDIDVDPVLGTIGNLLNSGTVHSADSKISVIENNNGKKTYYIKLSYYPEIYSAGIDPLMFITDLEKSGTILYKYLNRSGFPSYDDFDPEKFYLDWTLFYQTDKNESFINDIFCFVIDDSEIIIKYLDLSLENQSNLLEYSINGHSISDFISLSVSDSKEQETIAANNTTPDDRRTGDRRKGDRRNTASSSNSYIRVPTDKLENIFNTVSELLISQAHLNLLTEEHEETIPDGFGSVTDSLKNISKILQTQVTSLRMLSLSGTFDRFKRVVRDIASDRGKKIKLLTNGQDTELDKNMIEKLNDPLKHLVRNCIDHGIETESERIAAGKSPEGSLTLSAYLESGKVVLEVADDGRGINKAKLLKKAEEQGIISGESHLSDGEILNLIFHPGLSTAENITDLSGRGVGMDVVKNCINELNGNIDIISEENVGTTFKMSLPLTLAILDGMLISVGREKYIIPTLSILEIFRPESVHLKSLSGGQEVVYFRGDYIPMIRIHNILGIKDNVMEPEKAELIVINSDGVKAAILVDNVLEQYQIVLKSLQKNFQKVDHISSATILGDGYVALILDIQSLVQHTSTSSATGISRYSGSPNRKRQNV